MNVLQSRLRNRCSALHSDLYRANLIPNALCSCGKSDETAKHFLLHCKKKPYATMDNSSLIPYYNTQSELRVLTFGEIMYYQSNNLTTRARSMSQFLFFILGSV